MKFSINFPTYKTYLDEIQADYRAAWESQQHDLAKSQPLKRELALAKRSQAAEITNLKDSIQDSSRLAEVYRSFMSALVTNSSYSPPYLLLCIVEPC
jgi:hypothetical protein